jgi:hypothetical protein
MHKIPKDRLFPVAVASAALVGPLSIAVVSATGHKAHPDHDLHRDTNNQQHDDPEEWERRSKELEDFFRATAF